MKTIYNTYVEMESQEQCDRMKKLCIDNGLPYGDSVSSFELINDIGYNKFHYSQNSEVFFIGDNYYKFSKITEQEFIKLLQDERY